MGHRRAEGAAASLCPTRLKWAAVDQQVGAGHCGTLLAQTTHPNHPIHHHPTFASHSLLYLSSSSPFSSPLTSCRHPLQQITSASGSPLSVASRVIEPYFALPAELTKRRCRPGGFDQDAQLVGRERLPLSLHPLFPPGLLWRVHCRLPAAPPDPRVSRSSTHLANPRPRSTNHADS